MKTQSIDEATRDRCAVIERAFIAYVADELERYTTESGERVSPLVLGLCVECAFPVYRSEHGDKELYHYSPMRYQSALLTCGNARLDIQSVPKEQ